MFFSIFHFPQVLGIREKFSTMHPPPKKKKKNILEKYQINEEGSNFIMD